MRHGRRVILVPSLIAVFTAAAITASEAARPMVTDRPTRTDSPYSVPPEHFQVEMDALTFAHFAGGGLEVDLFSLAPLNLKYGFTPRVDVQLLITPWESTTLKQNGTESDDSGFGPLGMRIKYNITGNDGDGTAVALLPYVIAPTRGIEKLDHTLFGLMVPLAFPLEGGRTIGAAAGVEQVGDGSTFGRASVLFSTPVAGGWSTGVELYGIVDGFDDADQQIVTLDVVGVFAPRDDLALDVGVYYGITSDAEDWRVLAGLSARR